MLLTFTCVLTTIILFSLLFFLSGTGMSGYCIPNESKLPGTLRFGINYMLGLLFFLFLFRTLTYFDHNARVSLMISSAIILTVSAFSLMKAIEFVGGYYDKISLKNICILVATALMSYFVITTFWFFPVSKDFYASTTASLGSLHCGKYVGISSYIVDQNTIPVIIQNYSQSMLASIPMFLGLKSPQLALNLWLFVSIFVLGIMFYGFMQYLSKDRNLSLIGTFIMLFGNTALSFTHVLVIDSGSPFMGNGYSDSIFSITSFILFYIWANKVLDAKNAFSFKGAVIPGLLGLTWNYYAPQNIILALAMMAVYLAAGLSKRSIFTWKIFTLMMIFICFSMLGITQGGMLTPKRMQDDGANKIPGLIQIDNANIAQLNPVKWEIPFHFKDQNNEWRYGHLHAQDLLMARDALHKNTMSFLMAAQLIIFDLETRTWDSIRIVFFPLVGFLAYWLLLKWGKIKDPYSLLLNGAAVFAAGFCFAYFIYGNKWEVSRFLIPGYVMGLIAFVLSLKYLIATKVPPKMRTLSWLAVVFMMTFGPISNITLTIVQSLTMQKDNLELLKRLEFLIGPYK